MGFELHFSDFHVTDAHVGTPNQVVQLHFELHNTGDRALPANGAYVAISGYGGDRIAEGAHWVHEEIAAGSSKRFTYDLQCDPGEWSFSLMAFDPNQAWLANTDNVAHTVAGYPGAEHHQPQAETDAKYWLTLAITSIDDIDGGLRVHYAARNDGKVDAPPGTELIARANRDGDFGDRGTQDHVLESPIPVGHTVEGYLTIMIDPGHYDIQLEGATGTNATPTKGEATVKAP
jgi:hypothetical protein